MNDTFAAIRDAWPIICTLATLISVCAVSVYQLRDSMKKADEREKTQATEKAVLDTRLSSDKAALEARISSDKAAIEARMASDKASYEARFHTLEEAKTSTNSRLDTLTATVGELKGGIAKVESKVEAQNAANQKFYTESLAAHAENREAMIRLQGDIKAVTIAITERRGS